MFESDSKSRNDTERREKIRSASQQDPKNPCIKEQEMSYQCLNDNAYERDKCEKYFHNYRKCKEFWASVMKDRRRQGIVPHLPPAEEREIIKKEHVKKLAASS